MPLRRYHTPSLVRHASSASIFPPLASKITGLPPCRVPIPGPLVEMGSLVARVWAVEIPLVGEGFEVGEGDGDGVMLGDGEGSAASAGDGEDCGWIVTAGCISAAVLRA